MQRFLILAGVALLLAGLGWPWLAKLPLGRLPGDLVIERPHLKVCVPITTMLLVSLVVTILLRLFRK